MTPERWEQVKSALSDAMALAGPARAAFVERLGARDPALREELESLLAAERAAGSRFLERPAAEAVGASLGRNRLVGRRLGQYELLEEIGAGGMGEVYRAVRADEEYQQQVAIKLVRAGVEPQFVAQRLRAERQILASFEHPNIARLIDGGTTEEGVPYLVMELIEGLPITRYCDRHRLDVSARLALFLRVCAAVQYAHQRMVIHRDLKPSNILVTADGTPKLLDFGIAKILEPGAIPVRVDATVNAVRMLTPEYASPEQLKGEPVSTASDVYALGVVLYELLTCGRPYAAGDRVTRDVMRAVFDPELKRPSTVVRQRAAGDRRSPRLGEPRPSQGVASTIVEGSAQRWSRRLRGDLDNITMMALRKEPERRYPTVERLAEDIRRHLEHLPVSARQPTLRYRASSFITRHKVAVAAAAMIVVALVSGALVAAHEARIAESQRARAERRFNEVRQLANTLIFDVHDSIRDLPGAENSRRLLIHTALKYLDSLSQEAAGDPGLQRDLAAAYLRIGDLEGRAHEANESDYAGALASYRRAFALQQASLAAEPHSTALRDIIVTCGKLSDLLWFMGDAAGALSFSRETVERSQALAASSPEDPRFRYFLATSLTDHGYKLFAIRGEVTGALAEMRRSVAMLESLSASDTNNRVVSRTLSLAYGRLGEMLATQHDYARALSASQKARRLLGTLAASAPRNADFAHLLAFSEQDIADVLTDLGRLDEAAQHEQTALASFRSLAASDPAIAEYHWDVGEALSHAANIEGLRGTPRPAIALLEQSLAAMDAAPKGAVDASFRLMRAKAQSLLGDEYAALASTARASESERLRSWRIAREWYEKALPQLEALGGTWYEAIEAAKEARERILRCDSALGAGRSKAGAASVSRGAGAAAEPHR